MSFINRQQEQHMILITNNPRPSGRNKIVAGLSLRRASRGGEGTAQDGGPSKLLTPGCGKTVKYCRLLKVEIPILSCVFCEKRRYQS